MTKKHEHKMLEDLRQKLETMDVASSIGDEWECKQERTPKPLSRLVADWADLPEFANLENLPDFDHPDFNLLRPDKQAWASPLVQNTFTLVGVCFENALASYTQNKHCPSDEEVFALHRVAITLASFKPQESPSRRIGMFLTKKWITEDAIPLKIRKHALAQFTLAFWAFDQEVKDVLFGDKPKNLDQAMKRLVTHARSVREKVVKVRSIQQALRLRCPTPTVGFVSTKGGTGKTTLALACAMRWSREGKKVALLDMDIENPSIERLTYFFGMPPASLGSPLEETLIQENSKAVSKCLKNALTFIPSESLSAKSHTLQDREPGILLASVSGASHHREKLDKFAWQGGNWEIIGENFLLVLENLATDYHCDRIIIDFSPGLYGFPLAAASVLSALHQVLVFVTSYDRSDFGGLSEHVSALSLLFQNSTSNVLAFNNVVEDHLRMGDAKELLYNAWSEGMALCGFGNIFAAQGTSKSKISISADRLVLDINGMLYDPDRWVSAIPIQVNQELRRLWRLRAIDAKPIEPWNLVNYPEFDKIVAKVAEILDGIGANHDN